MYIYVCLYIYVYDIYISAWDGTVFFYDFRLAFPINLFIFCRIPTDGNRQSTIGNLQLAISDRVYIWSAQKKLSKEVAIWAAAASIFANCWLVYLQDTLPLTPPALLFASILYLFFFFCCCLTRYYCWFARSAGNLSTRTPLTGYAAALLPIDFQFNLCGTAIAI